MDPKLMHMRNELTSAALTGAGGEEVILKLYQSLTDKEAEIERRILTLNGEQSFCKQMKILIRTLVADAEEKMKKAQAEAEMPRKPVIESRPPAQPDLTTTEAPATTTAAPIVNEPVVDEKLEALKKAGKCTFKGRFDADYCGKSAKKGTSYCGQHS